MESHRLWLIVSEERCLSLCSPADSTSLSKNGGASHPGKESRIVDIACPPGETHDTPRWMVWFLAVVNGQQVHCGIAYQALRTHCWADFHDPLPACVAHRPRIETRIRALSEQGRCEEETVVMRTHDL